MWENEAADDDQAKADLRPQSSQCNPPERVPAESELLPCHYFDFFYGVSQGGLVATLLGRLRLRVNDAKDHFRTITSAMFGHKKPLRYIPKPILRMYRSTDFVNAVHDTIMGHSFKAFECGGHDHAFRIQSAGLSPTCEIPKQAQTGILVLTNTYDLQRQKLIMLRTFRSVLDEPLIGQLDLTYCQVLWAALGTPFDIGPFKASLGTGAEELSDAIVHESDPTSDAIRDYKALYQRPACSARKYLPGPGHGSSTCTNHSTEGGPAIFLSIGSWYTRSKDSPQRKHTYVVAERIRNESSETQGHMYVRLDPGLLLGDKFEGWRYNSESSFHAIDDSTKDAVNNNEELRQDLRRTAKELVRRRRARQAMGGPRWDVFVGNTVKVKVKGDDGAGNWKG